MDIFLQNLRSRTIQLHSLLEQKTALKNLLSQQVTIANYAVYLYLLYGFVKGFENNIFPLLQNCRPNVEERSNTHLLISDFNKPGINETEIIAIFYHFFFRIVSVKCNSTRRHIRIERVGIGWHLYLQKLTNNLGVKAIAGKATNFTAYGIRTGLSGKIFYKHFVRHH